MGEKEVEGAAGTTYVEFLTTGDVARLLRVRVDTVRKWVTRKGVEGVDYVRAGARRSILLIRREFLDRLLAPAGVTVEQLLRGEYVALKSGEYARLVGRSKWTAARRARERRVRCVAIEAGVRRYRFLVPREALGAEESTYVVPRPPNLPQTLSVNR